MLALIGGPMDQQLFLQSLEIVLSSGKKPDLSNQEMTNLVAHIKNLERCLADALRLAHDRKMAS